MKKPIILTFSIILLVMLVIFTLQNANHVQITYFFWDGYISLALLLFITLAIGIIVALIILVPVIAHLRKARREIYQTGGIQKKKGMHNDPNSAESFEESNSKFNAKYRR